MMEHYARMTLFVNTVFLSVFSLGDLHPPNCLFVYSFVVVVVVWVFEEKKRCSYTT